MQIKFTLNHQPVTLEADPSMRAIDLLREHCGLTGPKEGCSTGECGACAVWINGVTRLSCLMLAAQLQGQSVVTVEGVNPDSPDTLHPVQEAFVNCGAVQCGYCTPGMIMTAAQLLACERTPSRERIREAISGNLCRCTGYHKIVDAVEAAAQAMDREIS
ncbi:MAG: (2Fe-2S)-binding protein [Proteobacteria bacterium]|nr:(2Fe-2S)-binding protein [Desulfobacula sp.]MBU3954392.1 (2Fe-2S)-binding protein [Pseudomonadota bacterium]MBU4129546.1 (2Fe-2S)-binding protein [Pseudomonadota bacterium]